MKKSLLVVIIGIALLAQAAAQTQVSPETIVSSMEKKMYPGGKTEMKLVGTADGRTEEYKLTSYAKDNNQKIIVRFSSPSEMIGHDLLMLDRSVWLYDPTSTRVTMIPSNQGFGDTGFSYGDVLRLNYSDNYTPVIVSDVAAGWTLELAAKKRDAPYYKIVLVVAHDFTPVSGKCYTSSGELIKEMLYSNKADLGTGLKPQTVTVKSQIDPSNVSTLTTTRDAKKDYPDNIFNKRNLALQLEKQY